MRNNAPFVYAAVAAVSVAFFFGIFMPMANLDLLRPVVSKAICPAGGTFTTDTEEFSNYHRPGTFESENTSGTSFSYSCCDEQGSCESAGDFVPVLVHFLLAFFVVWFGSLFYIVFSSPRRTLVYFAGSLGMIALIYFLLWS